MSSAGNGKQRSYLSAEIIGYIFTDVDTIKPWRDLPAVCASYYCLLYKKTNVQEEINKKIPHKNDVFNRLFVTGELVRSIGTILPYVWVY